jgi:hypothetical protein
MPIAYFQVRLSVHPTGGGKAELVLPQALQGLNYDFVIVKDGGDEGIVKLHETDAGLQKVKQDQDCKQLPPEQVEELQKTYPPPKLKKKYRKQAQDQEAGQREAVSELFAVDSAGNRIVETFQTVRSGFYLIDVPVIGQPTGT